MKSALEILNRYRKAILIGLLVIGVWIALQNEAVDNAIGLFVVSGVVPGTHIILGPDVIMQIVVGIFAAAIAGFVVWVVMRHKIQRLSTSFELRPEVHVQLADTVAAEEYTIWERPVRPVRLPRAALPRLIAPHAAHAAEVQNVSRAYGLQHSAHALAKKAATVLQAAPRPSGQKAFALLPSGAMFAATLERIRVTGGRVFIASATVICTVAAWTAVRARAAAQFVRRLVTQVSRRSLQTARHAWRVSEPKIRQFDAYVERHVKRIQRWLHVKAAHNEMLSFIMQLYRQYFRRVKSPAEAAPTSTSVRK